MLKFIINYGEVCDDCLRHQVIQEECNSRGAYVFILALEKANSYHLSEIMSRIIEIHLSC